MKYGVGGINIDECRVPFEDTPNPATNPLYRLQNGYKTTANCGAGDSIVQFGTSKNETSPLGRFPSNVVLTYDETDFDEVCGGMPTGGANGTVSKTYDYKGNVFGDYKQKPPFDSYGDSGSAARYFYCAKASKRDRDEGLDDFEVQKTGDLQGGRQEGSAGSLRVRDDGSIGVNPYAGNGAPKKNTHPTVKPTALMQYLVRLVTPKGGIVLDPFNGSGSTGKAVMYENKDRNAGYKYIGIELTPEYLPIADARIRYAIGDNSPVEYSDVSSSMTTSKSVKSNGQISLFD
jgi:site-specific DNA-methyltransferase (adenine-specific)